MITPGKLINVAVLVYPNVELLDMVGPMDVFNKVNYYYKVNGVAEQRYNIYTVAESKDPIFSEEKLTQITPAHSIYDCPDPDIIVIPGIMKDHKSGVASGNIIDWITKKGKENKQILSICVGAFTLAATGLLAGKRATTHYMAVKTLANYDSSPAIIAVKNEKFVDDGANIVTTGGITCGIAGTLYLVEKIDGPLMAQQVADVLVFNRDAPLPPYTLLAPYSF